MEQTRMVRTVQITVILAAKLLGGSSPGPSTHQTALIRKRVLNLFLPLFCLFFNGHLFILKAIAEFLAVWKKGSDDCLKG